MTHPLKLIVPLLVILLPLPALAANWPAWRRDAGRSGTTDETLAPTLHLQWVRHDPPQRPAWPEDPRLGFDVGYEPIVVGKTVYVASSRTDTLTALDTDTGEVRWRFFAGGPIRFAPVVREGRAYFGADDGCLYCVDAAKGTLVWKFQAAPSQRRVIGNERLISLWPVRGGPTLVDNVIYFTVGVWPFEGTLLYGVDCATGRAVSTRTLDSVSPQGYLAENGGKLFIPCGRDSAYCLDLKSGKQVALRYRSRGLTDFHVATHKQWLFHGDKVVDAGNGRLLKLDAHRPVASDGKIYFTNKGNALAYDLANQKTVQTRDRKGKPITIKVPRPIWKLEGVTQIHVKAGNRLYGHFRNTVVAISQPESDKAPEITWKTTLEAPPSSMLVANGKLLAVTQKGSIYCFGPKPQQTRTHRFSARKPGDPQAAAKAAEILKASGTDSGYALVLGLQDGALTEELLRQSHLQIIAIDRDEQKVAKLRERLLETGLYGTRVAVHLGDPQKFALPPYLANLVVTGQDKIDPQLVRRAFAAVRPYGGVICLMADQANPQQIAQVAGDLPGAKLSRENEMVLLRRAGALPDSADWTHEYGDPSNTLRSRDKRVKAPLGVLWFGGPSADGKLFYDRHDWGPSLTVMEGRMFIQGPQLLTAVDVYTGRILWQKPIPAGDSPGRRANWKPTGYHLVAVRDSVYLAFPETCVRFDPKTGKQLAEFKLPDEEDQWGRIRIQDDLLIVPAFGPVKGRDRQPRKLVAMNRHTGKVVWTKKGLPSFPLVAVGSNKVFCFEGRLEGLYVGAGKRRQGGVPKSDQYLSLKAFDLRTGKDLWSKSTERAASWLAYSREHDVVLTANKNGINAWQGKTGEELWEQETTGEGFRGHPENYWGRVILWKDRVIDQRGPGRAYNVKTGRPVTRSHPVTGQEVPWEFTKIGHHCNYAIANDHLLTFRAASAGFCNLASGGTGRLEGFRSGCRNSLIPANGVLNAPNFAHGCVCDYSIFTSLALVHVPESDVWTYRAGEPATGSIQRLGVNLGAPGDRQDPQGTLWLDYPNTGGPSPKIQLKVAAERPRWFRIHSAQVSADSHRWVAASGVEGIESLTVPVRFDKAQPTERNYTVRLFFVEPDEIATGERVFDIAIQGSQVISNFDVVKEAGDVKRAVVKEFRNVRAAGNIEVSFAAKNRRPVLCGIEVTHAPNK